MRVVAAVWGAPSQFTAVLDVLGRDHDVVLVAPGHGRPLPPGAVAVGAPEPARGRPADRTRADFAAREAAFARAFEGLRDRDVDVVFGQVGFGAVHAASRVLGVPVVGHVELPGMDLAAARPDFPLLPQQREADSVLKERVFAGLRQCRRILTPSQHSRSRLPADLQGRAVVRMEGFAAQPPADAVERRSLRLAAGLPPDGRVVGFFARTLEAVRGFDVFAATAAALRRVRPGTVFLAVGAEATLYGNEGTYLDGESFVSWSLRRSGLAVADLDLRTWQPAAAFADLVRCVDLAVFPLYDSAGQWSTFHCLAQGVPIVAARSCFLPEVVRDGENGLLADLTRPATFAEACLRLIDDAALRARLGQRAFETVRDRFGVGHAAEVYDRTLRDAVASQAGG